MSFTFNPGHILVSDGKSIQILNVTLVIYSQHVVQNTDEFENPKQCFVFPLKHKINNVR